jgi:hypothetical protein
MSNPTTRIEDQLPYHYRAEYPMFITFLQKYYEWMYRRNLSQAEVDALRADTSWMTTDIEKYIATGQTKYIGTSVDTAIAELNDVPSPGYAADILSNSIALNITSDGFMDIGDEEFIDNNNTQLDALGIDRDIIRRKFLSMGYDIVEVGKYSLTPIDQVLMLSLLKHLYAIKGTEQSVKIFFTLFFGVDVSVFYPKINIAVIDDHFVLDGTDVIRDDYYFNEFSYVIKVSDTITSRYLDIFNNIYLKQVHPAGFDAFLVSNFAYIKNTSNLASVISIF